MNTTHEQQVLKLRAKATSRPYRRGYYPAKNSSYSFEICHFIKNQCHLG